MTERTYCVFATSTGVNGKNKIRRSNNYDYEKILRNTGHTNIVCHEFPEEMTTEEAVAIIREMDEFQTLEAQAAFEYYDEKKQSKIKTAPPKKRGRKPALQVTEALMEAMAKAQAERETHSDNQELETELEEEPF